MQGMRMKSHRHQFVRNQNFRNQEPRFWHNPHPKVKAAVQEAKATPTTKRAPTKKSAKRAQTAKAKVAKRK
jgi:hypothetical protein